MPSRQLPLPGFPESDAETRNDMFTAIHMSHVMLRQMVRETFDQEIIILRSMGQMNSAEMPDVLYLSQRKLCMSLKDVIVQLDILNDAMSGSVINE